YESLKPAASPEFLEHILLVRLAAKTCELPMLETCIDAEIKATMYLTGTEEVLETARKMHKYFLNDNWFYYWLTNFMMEVFGPDDSLSELEKTGFLYILGEDPAFDKPLIRIALALLTTDE
ncbi:hypothetical protein FQN49_006039, partial [Arthroderma sp. PD_2]